MLQLPEWTILAASDLKDLRALFGQTLLQTAAKRCFKSQSAAVRVANFGGTDTRKGRVSGSRSSMSRSGAVRPQGRQAQLCPVKGGERGHRPPGSPGQTMRPVRPKDGSGLLKGRFDERPRFGYAFRRTAPVARRRVVPRPRRIGQEGQSRPCSGPQVELSWHDRSPADRCAQNRLRRWTPCAHRWLLRQ